MPAAYQDQNGKWWKECSSAKQLFGGVDTIEELGEWFSKNKSSKDGFAYEYKKIRNEYHKNNKEKSTLNRYNWSKTTVGRYKEHKRKANQRGIFSSLTLEWFENQVNLPEFNYCSVSKIKFVDEPSNALCRSLDRIDSNKGYTPDNVRWICYKLNSWKADLNLNEVAQIFKYMAENTGYNPVEYMREVMNNNSTPHLTLIKESA
jgi:hypothetical protein